jgi:hypothetical protein
MKGVCCAREAGNGPQRSHGCTIRMSVFEGRAEQRLDVRLVGF